MQKKISSIISWNLLVVYLNKESKEGHHACNRIGNVFQFEENSNKRYYYFLEKDYVSVFEENKSSLKSKDTEELNIEKNKGNFKFASFPRIYRNEVKDITQQLSDRKYGNLNSFQVYLFILVFVSLITINYIFAINIAPVWIISIILTSIFYFVINVYLKKVYMNE